MFTYIETKDYRIRYELKEDVMFLHCDVEKFSPLIFKDIKAKFYDIAEVAYASGLDSLYTYTTNIKFCNMLMPCRVLAEIKAREDDYSVVEWDLLEE